jgi:ABC-type thiamine transport system ATPase subunit
VGRIYSNGNSATLSFKSGIYEPNTGEIVVDARNYTFVRPGANGLGSLYAVANLAGTTGTFELEDLYQ